ncbi:hypothetical protein ACQP1W_28040 [Spirillospora sp. CA-255316]
MSRKTVIPLAMVLVLTLTGCSDQSSGRGRQGGAPGTAVSSPSSSAATTAPPSGLGTVCQTVGTAAQTQLLAMALAIGDKTKSDSEKRADAAKSYQDFAERMSLLSQQAPDTLLPALMEWASASTAVARYIAEKKPRAGFVIDYGPTEKRWDAAQKAAEKICGHGLPDLDQ